ncbi:MAG: EamA family transporter [Leptolyngbyaceae cyanobacterium SL_5_9]|nr:EamA family transporter [Leptolyngbyaceae cyanobacterium SL_5_9]NJO75946.1 EamA family transporter [Leptolyngbyaceae cyanobacterium RM1_406_9]
MTPQEFILLTIALGFGLTGQLLLKAGALKLGKVTADNALDHLLSILTTPELLVGLGFYGFSAILYILLLTRVNISVAAPAVALSYVFSVLIGVLFFKETLPISRMVGVGMIMGGVVLVVWKH